MGASVCGMPAPLAEAASAFKSLRSFDGLLTGVEQKKNITPAQLDTPLRRRNEMTPLVFGALTRMIVMLAPLATAVFLVSLWLIGLIAARTLSESGGKMLAAL